MECFFRGINKRNCISLLRCEGVYKLAKKLGRSEKFAREYSRYILKLTVLHKLRDKYRDSKSKGFVSYFKKTIVKVLYYLCASVFKDTYRLEKPLNRIEFEIEMMEKENSNSNLMAYYEKVGEAYGLIFKNALFGTKTSVSTKKELDSLGNSLGTVVALRDSVIDLEDDIKKNNFNPFKEWEKEDINSFCGKNIELIRNKVEKIKEKDVEEYKGDNMGHNLKSVIASTISPAIMTIPSLTSTNLMQTNCCDSCTSFNNCCEGCVCPADTCLPTVILLGITALIITIVVLSTRKGRDCCGDCGGGGCPDCSGCDCDCDCSEGSCS